VRDRRCAPDEPSLTPDPLLERLIRENRELRALVADLLSTSAREKTAVPSAVPRRLFRDDGAWGAVAYEQGAAGRVLPLLHADTPSVGTDRKRGLEAVLARRGDGQLTRAQRPWKAVPTRFLRAALARVGLSLRLRSTRAKAA
jgi:hypothetical protein